MGAAESRPGREHIPQYPRGWFAIRIIQLILAVACIGLGAYAAAKRAWAGPLLTVWASVCTLIVTIWQISAHTCSPRAFNYWAVLVLDIYLYILWLGSMAACAVMAGGILALTSKSYYKRAKSSSGSSYSGGSSSSGSSSSSTSSSSYYSYYYNNYNQDIGVVTAAAAGLAAAEFLLFFICLITDSVVIHRHRKAGRHAKPIKGANAILVAQPQTAPAYQAVAQQPVTQYQQPGAYQQQPIGQYQQPQSTAYHSPAPYSYQAPQMQQQQQQPPAAAAYTPYNPQQGYYQPQPTSPAHTATAVQHTATPPLPSTSPYAPPPQGYPQPGSHELGKQ